MSCPNSQNPLVLNVSAGRLPEGFCPQNLQEFFDAMVARMIISPSEASLNIAGGSSEPSSNVGPWFKNCEELFVFDDDTGRYTPYPKGGFNNMQLFSASGSFVVPDGINKIKVSAWGGGGGGGVSGGGAGGGGGGGALSVRVFDVVAAQVIAIGIGAGGAAGSGGAATTVLTLTAGGGGAGVTGGGSGAGGLGGVATGGTLNFSGGSAAEGEPAAGAIGGSSPQGGPGGNTDFALNRQLIYDGAFPGGGGGGGAVGATPGAGGGGACLLEW